MYVKFKGKDQPTRPSTGPSIQQPDISWDQNLRQLRLGALIQQRAPSNAVIPRKRNSIAISHPILVVSESPPSSILLLPPRLRRPTSFNPYRSITSSLFPPLRLYQYRPNLLCRQIVFAFPRQCNPLETTLLLSVPVLVSTRYKSVFRVPSHSSIYPRVENAIIARPLELIWIV